MPSENEPRMRVEFTDEDDNLIVKYLLKYNANAVNRSGMVIWRNLAETEEFGPISKRHTAQSWRNRYVKNTEWFDHTIAAAQKARMKEGLGLDDAITEAQKAKMKRKEDLVLETGERFTHEEVKRLVKYLATHTLEIDRTRDEPYKRLVRNADNIWPWGSKRNFSSWRNLYVEFKDNFEKQIEAYQTKNFIMPIQSPRRNDTRPVTEQRPKTDSTSKPTTNSAKPKPAPPSAASTEVETPKARTVQSNTKLTSSVNKGVQAHGNGAMDVDIPEEQQMSMPGWEIEPSGDNSSDLEIVDDDEEGDDQLDDQPAPRRLNGHKYGKSKASSFKGAGRAMRPPTDDEADELLPTNKRPQNGQNGSRTIPKTSTQRQKIVVQRPANHDDLLSRNMESSQRTPSPARPALKRKHSEENFKARKKSHRSPSPNAQPDPLFTPVERPKSPHPPQKKPLAPPGSSPVHKSTLAAETSEDPRRRNPPKFVEGRFGTTSYAKRQVRIRHRDDSSSDEYEDDDNEDDDDDEDEDDDARPTRKDSLRQKSKKTGEDIDMGSSPPRPDDNGNSSERDRTPPDDTPTPRALSPARADADDEEDEDEQPDIPDNDGGPPKLSIADEDIQSFTQIPAPNPAPPGPANNKLSREDAYAQMMKSRKQRRNPSPAPAGPSKPSTRQDAHPLKHNPLPPEPSIFPRPEQESSPPSAAPRKPAREDVHPKRNLASGSSNSKLTNEEKVAKLLRGANVGQPRKKQKEDVVEPPETPRPTTRKHTSPDDEDVDTAAVDNSRPTRKDLLLDEIRIESSENAKTDVPPPVQPPTASNNARRHSPPPRLKPKTVVNGVTSLAGANNDPPSTPAASPERAEADPPPRTRNHRIMSTVKKSVDNNPFMKDQQLVEAIPFELDGTNGNGNGGDSAVASTSTSMAMVSTNGGRNAPRLSQVQRGRASGGKERERNGGRKSFFQSPVGFPGGTRGQEHKMKDKGRASSTSSRRQSLVDPNSPSAMMRMKKKRDQLQNLPRRGSKLRQSYGDDSRNGLPPSRAVSRASGSQSHSRRQSIMDLDMDVDEEKEEEKEEEWEDWENEPDEDDSEFESTADNSLELRMGRDVVNMLSSQYGFTADVVREVYMRTRDIRDTYMVLEDMYKAAREGALRCFRRSKSEEQVQGLIEGGNGEEDGVEGEERWKELEEYAAGGGDEEGLRSS